MKPEERLLLALERSDFCHELKLACSLAERCQK